MVPVHGAQAPSGKLTARSAADQGAHPVSITPVSVSPVQAAAAQPAQTAAQAPQGSAPPLQKVSEKPIPAQLPKPELVSAAPSEPPGAQVGRAVDSTSATSAPPAAIQQTLGCRSTCCWFRTKGATVVWSYVQLSKKSMHLRLSGNPAPSSKPSPPAVSAGGSPAHLQPAPTVASAGAHSRAAGRILRCGQLQTPQESNPGCIGSQAKLR